MVVIIGITGTLGAGKGTLSDILVRKHKFKHYSVRDFIIKEIQRRCDLGENLEINRDSMVFVANDLRTKNSPSYIIDCIYKEAIKSGENCIIESIRTPGEVESLRNLSSSPNNINFHLFAIDADPKIRYNRITLRQSETDKITFDTFLQNEAREMTSTDVNHQNIRACINLATVVFENNEQTIEELGESLNSSLSKLTLK